MASDPKIVKQEDTKKISAGAEIKPVGWTNPQQAASASPTGQSDASLGGVSAGSLSMIKPAGWTNPQAASSAGASGQSDSSLGGVSAGSLSMIKPAGWTNPQAASSAGASGQSDSSLGGISAGGTGAIVNPVAFPSGHFASPQGASQGTVSASSDASLGGISAGAGLTAGTIGRTGASSASPMSDDLKPPPVKDGGPDIIS